MPKLFKRETHKRGNPSSILLFLAILKLLTYSKQHKQSRFREYASCSKRAFIPSCNRLGEKLCDTSLIKLKKYQQIFARVGQSPL
ncbi:hypothetical protein CQA58_05005 [Helicobacter brantae]|uniref:Uncharacterized protein n=1 Tax=Helicobacter brantae TaxID=375927 RepID=A0A3D8J110_9HELI|nr:hypothetical protein CQA58_05005 [Helicobacter brantae]